MAISPSAMTAADILAAGYSPVDSVARARGDFQERLVREGEPFNLVSNNAAAPITIPTGVVNVNLVTTNTPIPTVGKVLWVETITVSVDAPAIVQINFSGDASNRFTGFFWQGIVAANTPCIVPVKQLLRGYQMAAAAISVSVRNNLTAGNVSYRASLAVNGWKITDDMNYNAQRTALFVGDSILNGTSGPNTTSQVWATMVRNHLAEKSGLTTRMVLKSISGSTSADHELWRAGGYHDIQGADIGFYAVSVNDAGASIAPAAYIANVTAFWAWWAKRYPGAVLFVCGTTPLENNGSETNAVALRAAASAYVASVSSPFLKYIDLSSSFDRTQGVTFYAGSDTAGSRVHPNTAGHASIGNAAIAALTAQGIVLA
jgi:lysophospholipase L1-like esterase